MSVRNLSNQVVTWHTGSHIVTCHPHKWTYPYNDVMAAILKVWRHGIYLKNNATKFHLDRIWNYGALGFFEEGCPNNNNKTTTWVVIWDQFFTKKFGLSVRAYTTYTAITHFTPVHISVAASACPISRGNEWVVS